MPPRRPHAFAVHAVCMLLAALALFAVASCSKPEPPTLTPKQARIAGVGPAGLDLRVELDAYNPNSFALSARKVVAGVKLDGAVDMGSLEVDSGVQIPPQGHATVEIPFPIKWRDIGPLAAMAASSRDVPFTVEGKATIGGDRISVDLPFRIDGKVTHAQLLQAASRSLPQIPGLPMPALPQ